MHKKFLLTASLLGALSVILGAFAAHKLKTILEPDVLQVFETAVKYQLYHAMALLAAGMLYKEFPVKQLRWAGYGFISGILLFSGSLYLLCFIKHQHLPATWVGAITPLGGLGFIAGWLMMAIAVTKKATGQ